MSPFCKAKMSPFVWGLAMRKGDVTLSRREVDRLRIMEALEGRRLQQSDAARQLGISTRQVKRLLSRYREAGAAGLASGHRGKTANNAIADAVRRQALELVQKHYEDFGPTLAHEKLVDVHGLKLSRETLRQWMIGGGIWQSKRQAPQRQHPRRARRPCRGELIQIDGSPHDWVEAPGAP